MGTFQADPADNADVQAALQAENAQLQADGLQAQQQALQAGLQPPPIILLALRTALRDGTMQRGEHTEANFR